MKDGFDHRDSRGVRDGDVRVIKVLGTFEALVVLRLN